MLAGNEAMGGIIHCQAVAVLIVAHCCLLLLIATMSNLLEVIPRLTVGAAGRLLQQRGWRAEEWKISTTSHPCHPLLPISCPGSSE